jgi:hypothetical protein
MKSSLAARIEEFGYSLIRGSWVALYASFMIGVLVFLTQIWKWLETGKWSTFSLGDILSVFSIDYYGIYSWSWIGLQTVADWVIHLHIFFHLLAFGMVVSGIVLILGIWLVDLGAKLGANADS